MKIIVSASLILKTYRFHKITQKEVTELENIE